MEDSGTRDQGEPRKPSSVWLRLLGESKRSVYIWAYFSLFTAVVGMVVVFLPLMIPRITPDKGYLVVLLGMMSMNYGFLGLILLLLADLRYRLLPEVRTD